MHLIRLWWRVTVRFPRLCIRGDDRGGARLSYLLAFLLAAAVLVVAFARYGDVIFDKFQRIADAIGEAA